MKIGIFDSGIGGLTVLHQARITLPEEEFIYYADSDHVPYGTKTKDEIAGYVFEAVDFFIKRNVSAIIIACNTATSVVIEDLRNSYSIPILGMEPAVKPAVKKCNQKRVMVCATPLTIREEKLKNLLRQVDEDHVVDLLALPELVRYAELELFESNNSEEYLRQALMPFQLEEYSAVILGCTHFNYFKDTFRRIFPIQAEFIDGSEGTVNHLKNILSGNEGMAKAKPSVEYYISGRKVIKDETLKKFERLQERLERMRQIM